MHVPDGFIDAATSAAAGAVAVAGVGLCLAGARRELTERSTPMAGLVAAFVFAVQMLNFPVGAGTSGHLLGGTLAAILIGPFTGALCVTVVLVVQAVMFADGGLTALGINVVLMALITTTVGYAIFRLVMKALPAKLTSVPVAGFVGALVSVPASAAGFVGFYALGATSSVPVGTVAAAMIGVHVLIGVGEGIITALTLSSVLGVRPDLVRAARPLPAEREQA